MFKKLAVTIGDPAGVGPDVIKKWAEAAPASLLKKVEVLGNKKFLDTLPAELGKRPVGDFSFEARAGGGVQDSGAISRGRRARVRLRRIFWRDYRSHIKV